MGMLYIKPGRNQIYAHYLMGLGLGIFIGGLLVGSEQFPAITTIGGLSFMVAATIISMLANKKKSE